LETRSGRLDVIERRFHCQLKNGRLDQLWKIGSMISVRPSVSRINDEREDRLDRWVQLAAHG